MASLEKLGDRLIEEFLPNDEYYHEVYKKLQYVLHHTVSGKGARGDRTWWDMDPSRIATAAIVEWKGDIWQLFDNLDKWAHHLGIKVAVFKENGIKLVFRKRDDGRVYTANNEILNQHSFGFEIDSWGPLMDSEGKWFPVKKDESGVFVPNTRSKSIPKEEIQFYPNGFRNYFAYEKYTDEALKTVEDTIFLLNEEYQIPLDYREDMWDVSVDALGGDPGVWTHVSFRKDKSDCHPQPELIQMLKGLSKGAAQPTEIEEVTIVGEKPKDLVYSSRYRATKRILPQGYKPKYTAKAVKK